VKSICIRPTATTGEPSGPVMPATSWPAPTATAAVSTPAMAAASARPARLSCHTRYSAPSQSRIAARGQNPREGARDVSESDESES